MSYDEFTASIVAEADQLRAERDTYKLALEEIREIWAGAEVGQPVHAQEAYAMRLCDQMYKAAVIALAKP